MTTSADERLRHPGAATNSDGGADAGEGDRGALLVAEALRTVTLQVICAQCGKQGTVKRCSICKQVSYCGVECQNKAWKRHKKTCAPPLSTDDVRAKVLAADAYGEDLDWLEVLKWESRMDEMMEDQPDATCNLILQEFQHAHWKAEISTGCHHHTLSSIRLLEQRVELLGKMQRFRDQGEAMCGVASGLCFAEKYQEAAVYFQKARKVAEEHGFFSVECKACVGLGNQAILEGRYEEGTALLRNALAALPLVEHDLGVALEVLILAALIDSTNAVDQLEPLILRFHEAAKVRSAAEGRLCFAEFSELIFTARLHEVRAFSSRVEYPFTLLCPAVHPGR